MKLNYIISPEIKGLGIKQLVVAEIHDVAITKENSELEKLKDEVSKKVMQFSDEDISNNQILESYRFLVKSVGRSLKKFPPAAESLINIVKKNGRFPHINTVVDSYNTVVAQTFLALGVHDIDKLQGPITFRLSKEPENFTSVGSESVKQTQPGDYVYADENLVLAWLDSKDSELVKISLETKNIVIVIQGTPFTKIEYTKKAIEDACALIINFCGGTSEIKIIE